MTKKSEYKKTNGKNKNILDILRNRSIFATTKEWNKWAKKSLNRSYRRKERQKNKIDE